MKYITASVETGSHSFQFTDRAENFGPWLGRITADNWQICSLLRVRTYFEWDVKVALATP